MNPRNIAFWSATLLVVLPNSAAALGYLSGSMDDNFVHLQLPLYLPLLLGVWKLLGAVALLTPLQQPWVNRVKEWAYAGYFFTLSGAAFCHAAVGDTTEVAPPLVLLAALVVSYVLRTPATAPVSLQSAMVS